MPHCRPPYAFGLFSALVLVIDPAPLLAADAKGIVLYATDVYTGPGRYPILGRIKRGEQVEIDSCDAGRNWCLIVSGKIRGWISGNAFEIGTKGRRPPSSD